MSYTEPFNQELQQQILWDLSQEVLNLYGDRANPAHCFISELVQQRSIGGLCAGDIQSGHVEDADTLFAVTQVAAFFRKNESLLTDDDMERLESEAFDRYLADEARCKETNEDFRAHRSGGMCFLPHVDAALLRMQRKIRSILGPCPRINEIEFLLGPGASTSVKRRQAHPAVKLDARPVCSPNTVPWLGAVMLQLPHYLKHHASECWVDVQSDEECWRVDVDVENARLEFVPKDARKLRSIAIEPHLTGGFQLGIGEAIARRLKRAGCDITNQQTNADFARYGSLRDCITTLDLSSASDLISYEVVKFLVPEDWFSLLTGFRSPCVDFPARDLTLRLEKFSSMGNGFTFPLETLIFYAAALAVTPSYGKVFCNAYGDDIVVPVSSTDRLVELLHALGFRVNVEKTFSEGPFRESCGKDYFRGQNVRPLFVKDGLNLLGLFRLHNGFTRMHRPELAAAVLRHIPPANRLYGPDGYGDGHLLGDYLRIPHRRDDGWCGSLFRTVVLRGRVSIAVHPGDHMAVLYNTELKPDIPFLDLWWERLTQLVKAGIVLPTFWHGVTTKLHSACTSTTVRRNGRYKLKKTYPRSKDALEYDVIEVYHIG